MLEVNKVTKNFVGLRALDEVSFEIEEGEIVGLIGPNGSGKTTLFNIISGFYSANGGEVLFKGKPIGGLKPHLVCKMGIVRTFQIPHIFSSLTAMETLIVAGLGRLPKKEAIRGAQDIIERVGLAPKAKFLTGKLTAADQKLLEIARALACQPEILLIDEMLSGLTSVEVKGMIDVIRMLHEQGITIIMVEHVMHIIMNLCPHIIVLNFGKKIAEGGPQDIANNQTVIESYLGKGVSFAQN